MRTGRFPLLIAIAMGAAACGQKGPLILPDAHAKAPVPAATPAVPDYKKDKIGPARGP